MPAITGMIIHSAPKGLKELSNSIAYVCYNCLGYLPSPFLYGVASNMGGGKESRTGMMLLMFWTIVGNIFIQLALVFKSKSIAKQENVMKSLNLRLIVEEGKF